MDLDSDREIERIIYIGAIIAMIAGVIIAVYLIRMHTQQSYSEIYIYPNSYTNYINRSKLPKEFSFRYGIRSHELREETYEINIYLGDTLVKSKEVKIKKGGTFEENETILIPRNITFPTKVKIVVSVDNTVYEAHIWLKEESH